MESTKNKNSDLSDDFDLMLDETMENQPSASLSDDTDEENIKTIHPELPDALPSPAPDSGFIKLSRSKISVLKKILEGIREETTTALAMLDSQDEDWLLTTRPIAADATEYEQKKDKLTKASRVVEGVFDGEKMIGPDGKHYSIPANYASKSKLVEGDMLKLTIAPNGSFLYKQIGPIERNRTTGTLAEDTNGNYYVIQGSQRWRILTASVTYFRGSPGDSVVVLFPKGASSRWAAVENIIKQNIQ